MKTDDVPLDAAQCLRLMAGTAVGRVVYTRDALPAVLPVRFRLLDGCVLVDAGDAHQDLLRAVDGAVVAFETGELNVLDGSGWSVTVLGLARAARRPRTMPGPDREFIRIRSQVITGRRLDAALPVCPGE